MFGFFQLPNKDGDVSKKRSESEMIYFKGYQNQYAYRRRILNIHNSSTWLPGDRCEI